METQKSTHPKDHLPRIVCAFAAFFTFAVPALAIAVGIASHSTLVELAVRAEEAGMHDGFACGILDWNRVFAWTLLVLAVGLSLRTFGLARRNNTAGTLIGSGNIVFALGFSGMASAFYLGALLVAAGRLLIPFLLR